MKIHHLNCGTLNPRLVNVRSLVYCLLVESPEGLFLIDTGFGTGDYQDPSPKMSFFLNWMGVPRDPEETALYQIQRLGFKPKDVRHIILTHLHIDHAGGLVDFPWARIHVYRQEFLAAQNPKGLLDFAYVPSHWDHNPDWVLHDSPMVEWLGLQAIPIMETTEVDFLFIPLPGHTRGHCGVAVGKPGRWLLHCGDAASPFHEGADLHRRGPDAYVMNILPDWVANRILGGHVHRLRSLLESDRDEVQIISSHDSFSFQEYNQLPKF